jgi:hypothetical protein
VWAGEPLAPSDVEWLTAQLAGARATARWAAQAQVAGAEAQRIGGRSAAERS